MAATTPPQLTEMFSLERLIVREDLQQDKRTALLAVAHMFDDYHVPYVIVGGVALQLYSTPIRTTADVDVVSLREPFEKLKANKPWGRYGLELVFDRRRFLKLKATASNVEVDINVDSQFAHVVDQPVKEQVEGYPICFCSLLDLAFTKLRTQRPDWPRNYARRLQDRADLARMLQTHPEVRDLLRQYPFVTDEMRGILDDICRELAASPIDDFPPEGESTP